MLEHNMYRQAHYIQWGGVETSEVCFFIAEDEDGLSDVRRPLWVLTKAVGAIACRRGGCWCTAIDWEVTQPERQMQGETWAARA